MEFIRTSFILILAIVTLTGCASVESRNPADPMESFNRGMFAVNDTVDKAITKPIAVGYNKVMPTVAKQMVTNFFSNLDDVVIALNDLLQFKFVQGFSDGTRVLVNSTLGVGGLIDVASMRLEKHNEDFGQTLGYWGVPTGPYLVLPILGPSTIRDGLGLYVDGQPSKLRRIKHMRTRNQLYLTKAVNQRARLISSESVLEGVMIDRYGFIRDAYLQRRQSLVYDGNPPQEQYELDDSSFEYEPEPEPVSDQSSIPKVSEH